MSRSTNAVFLTAVCTHSMNLQVLTKPVQKT